ncbi:DUF6286 domain-containing protein [Cumulibacter manganitolerans]|uniref:DUF6286 domain-containing protein n=1 Tax=Cumulibacter manganitolerans TaxID=1884992 RepID=UPI0012954131|nr:DUF6286 domain-containing protein [Cumulibacter manganitolerans]
MSTGQRILLRFVSALAGLLLVGAALLGLGQIVAALTGSGDFIVPFSLWYRSLRTTPWSAGAVVYTGIGLLVGGVLLIVVATLSRPRLFALARPTDDVDVVIAPRAVAQMLRRQAEAVSGVATASVEVSADVARVNATAPLAGYERVEADLEAALTHALKKIPWQRLPRLDLEVVDGQPRTEAATLSGPAGPAGSAS